ncbi:MAG: F0F1 ATP synthase subunit delta [Candidatus Saccharimonadales bacterium]
MERLRLPNAVVGEIDISRLRRELNGLSDFFVSSRNRAAGTSMQAPKLSRLLDELAKSNRINLLEETERGKLAAALDQIHGHAPRLQISFAADPPPKAMDQVVTWLRQNIHPHTLVQVGLQPAIAAGCVLRTSNKVFDMSLRANLKKQEPYLAKLIVGAVNER